MNITAKDLYEAFYFGWGIKSFRLHNGWHGVYDDSVSDYPKTSHTLTFLHGERVVAVIAASFNHTYRWLLKINDDDYWSLNAAGDPFVVEYANDPFDL